MKRFLLCVESEVLASGCVFCFFFFDHEALDCCKRIFCGIPGCYTGSTGLGSLWQLPQLRTCLCRIPVLLHLSRSRACVNLERASCWQERSVHAIPTQAPQNHKSSPFKVPFTTRMSSLLLHGELGLLTEKKKNWGKNQNWLLIELPGWMFTATAKRIFATLKGNTTGFGVMQTMLYVVLWMHTSCDMGVCSIAGTLTFPVALPGQYGHQGRDPLHKLATTLQKTHHELLECFSYSYLLFNKCFFQLLCCL